VASVIRPREAVRVSSTCSTASLTAMPRACAVVAVGTALAGGPPRRSQRAGLPHWAPIMGVRLCPSSIAMGTPQTFPMASRYGYAMPPGSSRRPGGQRCALHPAQIRQVRAGAPVEGRNTPVPRVLLSATLAGPAPSGSTRTSRLCQGCPQLQRPAATGRRRRSLTSTRTNSASRRNT
jgi:hypothetical protein